jgi:hypothetical protein
MTTEVIGKSLGLFKQTVPKVSPMAVLWNPDNVVTRSRKTCNEPCPHRIAIAYNNDRDRAGRILGCQRRLRYHRNNDVNIELDQLRRKLSETIKIPVRKSVLNWPVLAHRCRNGCAALCPELTKADVHLTGIRPGGPH